MYLRTSCLLLAGLALLSAFAIANSYPQSYGRDEGSCARRRHRHHHNNEYEQYDQDSGREHYDRDHEDEHRHYDDFPYAELKKDSVSDKAKVRHSVRSPQQQQAVQFLATCSHRWCCNMAARWKRALALLTFDLGSCSNKCHYKAAKAVPPLPAKLSTLLVHQ
jgi:hypothetical protein